MDDRSPQDTEAVPMRTGILAWAVKVALAAGLLGLGATQYLAGLNAPSVRMAANGAARAVQDPETTGSIAAGARAVRLDPCVAAPLRNARP